MPKKPSLQGGKRDEIIEAALGLFFTGGYDGTSVRKIMSRAGGEIGLFYYYFKNKDEVFDRVLDRFFAHYEADFARIVAQGRRNPCRVMSDFFEYMERETALFRAEHAKNMHRTVRWAIREHTLTIIEPYLREVVEIQSAYYGVKPALAPEVAALYLTHGVGSAILHEDHEAYAARRTEVKRGISLIMGMPLDDQELRIPYWAKAEDLPGWKELLTEGGRFFPALHPGQCAQTLEERFAAGEAWVIRDGATVAAALLYSPEEQTLDFLSVHPDYRRQGLATRLVETAAAQFPVGTELCAVLCCGEDAAGKAACGFLRALGFAAGEALTVSGHPSQRFTLLIPKRPPGREY